MNKAIIPLFTVGTAIALFFMFTDAKFDEIKLLEEEEAQFDTALALVLELGLVKERLESEYNTIPKEDLAKLERLLTDKVDPTRLVYDINNIAAIHGKKLESINVVTSSADKSETENSLEKEPNSITITISIKATYNELLDFIRDLEKSLQIIDIESIEFSVAGELSSQTNFTYNIVLRMYTL